MSERVIVLADLGADFRLPAFPFPPGTPDVVLRRIESDARLGLVAFHYELLPPPQEGGA